MSVRRKGIGVILEQDLECQLNVPWFAEAKARSAGAVAGIGDEAGAALYFVQGKTAEALAQWRMVLEIEPDHVPVLSQMAVILATNPDARIRNGAQAVTMAERTVQLTNGQDPMMLDTLAAAYAEVGRFDEAVQITNRNLAMARQQGNQQVLAMLSAKLSLYQAKTPYRERR